MLLLTKFLAKTLSILNSEISPRQIAAGFAFGVWMGLLPLNGYLPTFFLILSFLININLTIMFVAAGVAKIIAFGIDPIANQIGYTLLVTMQDLKPFWTKLYNMPVVPYTKFNNTLVLGSFVLGLFLLIPMYLIGHAGVTKYRTHWREKILKTKVMQLFKASTVYKLYSTYRGISGE